MLNLNKSQEELKNDLLLAEEAGQKDTKHEKKVLIAIF